LCFGQFVGSAGGSAKYTQAHPRLSLCSPSRSSPSPSSRKTAERKVLVEMPPTKKGLLRRVLPS
ncbi:unnamed protein product, partial [Ectocarpus sp. 13 AM-2016]